MSRAMWRGRAVLELLLFPLLFIISGLWYGFPGVIADSPMELRRAWKTLLTGKPGPSAGITW